MPRRSLSQAQQSVHKPDKSMAQKWRLRCCGRARSHWVRQVKGIFRNDDRVLCHHRWPVRVMKRRRELLAMHRRCVPEPERFKQSVTAVTGSTAQLDSEITQQLDLSLGQLGR
jgi:hypothetical protein